MNKNIYLIRHCEIDRSEVKRYIGRTDLPLNDAGIRQSHELKKYFSRINIEEVFISPLKRARQTAEIIVGDRNIEITSMDGLLEIDMGDWENLSMSYMKSRYHRQYVERGGKLDVFIPPNGENFEQVQKRAMGVFENIISNTVENVIIVAHAGVNRAILSKILCFPLKNLLEISQPYGCVNRIYRDKGTQHWTCETISYEGGIQCEKKIISRK